MQNTEQFDFIAIGDVVTDAFIRIKEAHLTCSINNDNCEICMKFADKIPYESVTICAAVGNSPNAATSAGRLGLKTALISNLGDDSYATEALETLKSNNIDTRFVQSHVGMKTNYHYVLWYQQDRTILIKHEDFPLQFPDVGNPKWIYLSSLGEHSLEYHKQIGKYLIEHPEVKLAFQPGTFQIRFGTEAMKDVYARTEIFFCNVEEAQKILNVTTRDVKELAQKVMALGPKIAVITDGPAGAYAYDGTQMFFLKPYPDPKPPLERTGAGDAFSSTFTIATILGKSIAEAMQWGAINSMSVVQDIGAQRGLLTQEKIEEYLANRPSDWEAEVK